MKQMQLIEISWPFTHLIVQRKIQRTYLCNTKLTRYIFILTHSEVQWICTKEYLLLTTHSFTLLEYVNFLPKLITIIFPSPCL